MFKGKSKAIVQLWIATLVIFGILALGPYLHVNGGLVSINNRPLTLPYLLLYQTIPFINIIRSLSRFAMMVMLALAMLATIGIAWLLEGISGQQLLKPTKKTSLATATLFGLILIEYLAIPFPYSEIDTPSFFRQLAEDKDQYAIAYLPMNWDRPVALLYQTVHQKYLATAYTSREQPISRAWRTPLLQNWRYLDEDIVRTDLSEIAATVLHDLNIRLVIMDYFQMPPGTERKETERWVAYAFKNAIPRYKDSRLTVYQAPVPSQAKSYLTLEEGWGDREFIHNSLVRPIIGIATLGIHHPLGRLSLRLELINPGSPSKFSIWVDDRPITTALLPKGYYSLDTGSFTAGETGTQTVILKLETEAPMFLKSIELKSQH